MRRTNRRGGPRAGVARIDIDNLNGRIAQELPTAQLAADRELQERLWAEIGPTSSDPKDG